MSTTLASEPTPVPSQQTPPGTKTLSVKNVPHAVWQRARQNALASNLSFGDYVVKLLGTAGPFPPTAQTPWDILTGSPLTGTAPPEDTPDTHHSPARTTDGPKGSE